MRASRDTHPTPAVRTGVSLLARGNAMNAGIQVRADWLERIARGMLGLVLMLCVVWAVAGP